MIPPVGLARSVGTSWQMSYWMAGEAAKKPEIPILAQVRPPHIRKDGPKPREGCLNQIEAQDALGPLLRRRGGRMQLSREILPITL